MSNEQSDPLKQRPTYHRRTVMGALATGAGLGSVGGAQALQDDDQDEDWWPPDASEAHAAILTGHQASVETNAGGCAHVVPWGENTLMFDLVLEDISCVTQAHIHEGERGEDGPVVAPLFEFTENPDGTGSGDPLTTSPDTPLIHGATVDDPDLVDDILANPTDYYVNVHTTHNPGGEIRGQIRGFDFGQETEIEPHPADFTVLNLNPRNARVVQGAHVDISATIRNAGDVTETQTVELRIDGEVIDQRQLELRCRESRTVTFENVDTGAFEPGEYTHGVFTDDDEITGTLRILRPPEFIVSDLDPRDVTVTQGDIIDVSATIENVGEAPGNQTVEFRVDDDVLDDEDLALEGGDSERVTFEDIDTADLEPGEYTHGIFTEDDEETATLTVQAPAEFLVSNLEPPEATVTQGDVIDVSATVTNEGGQEGTQDVELRIDEELDPDDFVIPDEDTDADQFAFLDSQEVTLDPNESQTVTFEDVDTGALDPSEYEHGIFTEDDSETGTLTVEELPPAEFTVMDLDPVDVAVEQGELIDVQATIENTGEEAGTQTVEFRVDGDVIANEEISLDAGASDLVIFTEIDTAPLDPGDYEHGIFTDDDEETGTLTVEAPPAAAEFSVFGLDPVDVAVEQGELIDVQAVIENTGEAEGTQTVEFRVDGNVIADEEISLDAGASNLVIFTDIDTTPLEPDDYEHGIFTEDDSETGTLTVEEDIDGAPDDDDDPDDTPDDDPDDDDPDDAPDDDPDDDDPDDTPDDDPGDDDDNGPPGQADDDDDNGPPGQADDD